VLVHVLELRHQAILNQSKKASDFSEKNSLRFIRSGAASLSLNLLNELETVYEVPVIEGYGMTESEVISCNPMPPGARKQGSVGLAYGNCIISIVDKLGQKVAVMTEGEIVIQVPTMIKAYIDNESANQKAFNKYGFCTGDLGYLDKEGYLFITGRIKEIINRGGEKISPAEVDQVLLSHPAVKEVVTFPVPHITLGENVAAVVTLVDDKQAIDPEALRLYVRQQLAEFKVPYDILVSEHIPKGSTGKVQRHKMAKYFAAQLSTCVIPSEQHRVINQALTPLQEILLSIWKDILRVKELSIHDKFLALGGDSLTAMQLMTRMIERLQIEIPFSILFETATIAELSARLELILGQKNTESTPIKPLQRNN